ncbi:hypothetical protein, partial [Bacillus cereus]|uniref:hypothetical protein n=1 Tax=Bacillus cereus TaxID=1396 RepID=UPI002111FA42
FFFLFSKKKKNPPPPPALTPTKFLTHPKNLGAHFTYIGGFCTTKKRALLYSRAKEKYITL